MPSGTDAIHDVATLRLLELGHCCLPQVVGLTHEDEPDVGVVLEATEEVEHLVRPVLHRQPGEHELRQLLGIEHVPAGWAHGVSVAEPDRIERVVAELAVLQGLGAKVDALVTATMGEAAIGESRHDPRKGPVGAPLLGEGDLELVLGLGLLQPEDAVDVLLELGMELEVVGPR